MAELVDAHDSKSCSFGSEGSSPSFGTFMDKIITIIGPTAVGKTEFSILLAKKFNFEIVSADSRQIYKKLNYGTGKINEKEKQGIKHYLIDEIEPEEDFNVFKYQEMAEKSIKTILNKNKIPLIVGGSPFYIQSILYKGNLANVNKNEQLRNEFEKLENKELLEYIYKNGKIKLEGEVTKNKRRLVRYAEIVKNKGELKKERKEKRYNSLNLGIFLEKEELKLKIEERLKKRWNYIIKEIEQLIEEGVSTEWLISLGLEYKYITEYILKGKNEKELYFEKLKTKIFQFSKRQMTWFKKDKDIIWKNNQELKDFYLIIEKFIKD